MRLVFIVALVACGAPRVEERPPTSDPAGGAAATTAEPIDAPVSSYKCIVGATQLIVVLPFDGEVWPGGPVTERFRAEAGTPPLQSSKVGLSTALVVRRECVTTHDDACMTTIGRKQRIDWILAGAVAPNASGGTVAVRLVSMTEPTIVRSATFDFADSNDLAAATHHAWVRLSAM